jgi:septin 7
MVLRTETPPTVTSVDKELNGYVGFANLPNQVFRKSVKRGFEFTLMVVGK